MELPYECFRAVGSCACSNIGVVLLIMIPNTTEAAVSRVDLPKMKKVRNATIVANRTNHNCAGSGQVSIGRIIFVSGLITSRYSANSMNFAVG